jgi:hypothetical protein
MVDIREKLAPFYSEIGRPSIDPELLIRMLIVGYLEDAERLIDVDNSERRGKLVTPRPSPVQRDHGRRSIRRLSLEADSPPDLSPIVHHPARQPR